MARDCQNRSHAICARLIPRRGQSPEHPENAGYDRRGRVAFLRHCGEYGRSSFCTTPPLRIQPLLVSQVATPQALSSQEATRLQAGQASSTLKRIRMTVTDQIPSTATVPVGTPQIRCTRGGERRRNLLRLTSGSPWTPNPCAREMNRNFCAKGPTHQCQRLPFEHPGGIPEGRR